MNGVNASSVTRNGQAPVTEGHLGERELAREPCRLEPLQAGRAARAEAERALVRRLEPRFEHAHERRARAAIHPNGGERVPGALPRSGRLKICQSRSCPRPPSPIEPAPTPPSGNEICDNRGPVKTRGYVTRGGDAPGCAEAGRAVGAGAAGGETCPAPSAAPTGMAAAAAAALSDCLRKSRRPCAAGTFFDGMVAEYRRFPVRKAGGGT